MQKPSELMSKGLERIVHDHIMNAEDIKDELRHVTTMLGMMKTTSYRFLVDAFLCQKSQIDIFLELHMGVANIFTFK